MKLTYTVFLTLLTISFTMAQITITSGDLTQLIGRTQVMETDSAGVISVNLGNSGENQTWDFTSNAINAEYPAEFKDPADTPYGDDLPDANFAIVTQFMEGGYDVTAYNYEQITSSYVLTLNTILEADTGGTEPFIISESKNDSTPLPLSFGAKWTQQSISSLDIGIGGFENYTISNIESEVDAWGKVTIPAGTFDCLRLLEKVQSINNTVFMDVIVLSDTTYSVSHHWITKDNYIIVSTGSEDYDEEPDPNYTSASYFGRQKSMTTAIEERDLSIAAQSFKLEQNYPNPFNPVTTIKYNLDTAGPVQLKVFDLLGREIAILVNNTQAAGSYSVQFNAANLSSGVYLYQIQSPSGILTRKMFLMK